MPLIAFSQPDTNLSDDLMAPVMKPDNGVWRSGRVVVDEAIPGKMIWAYVPGRHGAVCEAFQWGKIIRGRWQPHAWTIEENDLDFDWRAPDRIALVPMRGVWHWPMGMNLPVLHALRKTRNEPNRVEEGRELVSLSDDPFVMVLGVRGASWRIVRERKQKPYWKPHSCILIITKDGRPLIESNPWEAFAKYRPIDGDLSS